MKQLMSINDFEKSYEHIYKLLDIQNKIINNYNKYTINLQDEKQKLEYENRILKKKISCALENIRNIKNTIKKKLKK